MGAIAHRVLCFFGLHLWSAWEHRRQLSEGLEQWSERRCECCDRVQQVDD